MSASVQEKPLLPALLASPGVVGLSGTVRTVDGEPLAGVSLTADCDDTTASADSDDTGRFLITPLQSGHCQLDIDGTRAGARAHYGRFFAGVDLGVGTTVLPYVIWMTPIEERQVVEIPSPTTEQVTITTDQLPGLKLILPKDSVIRDFDGNVLNTLSLTSVPVGRPPFPLPTGVSVPLYFSIQPGGGYLEIAGSRYGNDAGAQLIYPNSYRAPAGTKFDFWDYDPEGRGWYVYGTGTVSADLTSIAPDPGVVIHRFTGAMVTTPSMAPPKGPNKKGPKDGDPVDLGTGLFTYTKTDLVLPDVMPITIRRSYISGDSLGRAFGVGTSQDYDMFLAGDAPTFSYVDVILANGSRAHFTPLPATGQGLTATFGCSSGPFLGSTLKYGNAWVLSTAAGTTYTFNGPTGTEAPAALLQIADRNGNTLVIARDSATQDLLQVTSPNGRWVKFSRDPGSNRVLTATDSAGRSVVYDYDGSGRLAAVTDVLGGVTKYTYDASNRLLSIQDAHALYILGIPMMSNGGFPNRRCLMAGPTLFLITLTSTATSWKQTSLTLGVIRAESNSTPRAIFQADT